jgi:hypothetical protein
MHVARARTRAVYAEGTSSACVLLGIVQIVQRPQPNASQIRQACFWPQPLSSECCCLCCMHLGSEQLSTTCMPAVVCMHALIHVRELMLVLMASLAFNTGI